MPICNICLTNISDLKGQETCLGEYGKLLAEEVDLVQQPVDRCALQARTVSSRKGKKMHIRPIFEFISCMSTVVDPDLVGYVYFWLSWIWVPDPGTL